ncbi:hypothetical protein B0T16DRAFT_196714 [Cercophora newfieldiana]|uniref:Uncharacterized protein n=1 Tax=Cercophora newfieldiana TaxID=92897 RepID=A0AA40CMX1_9PEZI|nr:hypothetical protein B0T16DRAFT_196714 [Cercophora newfieldiana]
MVANRSFILGTLLARVFANPITPVPEENEAAVLSARQAGSGVHLVNCGNSYSTVVYCINDSNCNFYPAKENQCIMGISGLFKWEGVQGPVLKGCTFSTGVRFEWGISPLPNIPVYAEVGPGQNGFQTFKCFKDNKRTMYSDGLNQCKSIYYCLPR